MQSDFKNYLLKTTHASSCSELEVIQSLWSGYGKISRYQLDGSLTKTVVVKHISLNQLRDHPRGWNTDYSHQRKVRSYQIETHWYKAWSHQCNIKCTVPKLIGEYSEGSDQWIILEDLNTKYPLRKYQLNLKEIKACLEWLANFHLTFLDNKPTGLWQVGTYWNLETRPDEFKKIEHRELKSKAHLIDHILNNCKYQTIVHGDAKLANFCFSQDGNQIAAVDFQYVGGGCGIKDVAYFLGSCLTSDELELLQAELLDYYFLQLHNANTLTETKLAESTYNVEALEREWREMYPIACTDFNRFLLGWMPTHQKLNKYNRNLMNKVLASI